MTGYVLILKLKRKCEILTEAELNQRAICMENICVDMYLQMGARLSHE